jgi:hypothetical protein
MRLKLETITVCCTVARPFVGISLQIRYVTISDYKSCGHSTLRFEGNRLQIAAVRLQWFFGMHG